MLLAEELLSKLHPPALKPSQAPPVAVIQEALTGTSCQLDFDYELMETMGDSFVKYCANMYLFK